MIGLDTNTSKDSVQPKAASMLSDILAVVLLVIVCLFLLFLPSGQIN